MKGKAMLKRLIETCVLGVAQAVEERLPDPGAFVLKPFRRILQFDGHTCGLRSTEMVLRHHGIAYNEKALCRELKTDEDGTCPTYINQALRRRGLVVRKRRRLRKNDLHQFMLRYQTPAIVGLMNGEHYAVAFGVSDKHVWVADPLPQHVATRWPWKRFLREWDGEAVFACKPRRRTEKRGRDRRLTGRRTRRR
jgi:ABC-type bacteriocin/lantibiotic exporter with double-glycine peptidase domain